MKLMVVHLVDKRKRRTASRAAWHKGMVPGARMCTECRTGARRSPPRSAVEGVLLDPVEAARDEQEALAREELHLEPDRPPVQGAVEDEPIGGRTLRLE